MEEELGEKIEILQRELGQARAFAGDSRQVEELKKVFGSWGTEEQVGVVGACLTYPQGPHTNVTTSLVLGLQASRCLLSLTSLQHTVCDSAGLRAGLLS